MSTIEEALQQAALLSVSDENWIQLVKYPTKVFYEDMAGMTNIDLESKTIEDFNDNVSTKEENNSQYITFIMDRFYDGVDLVNMLIQIDYLLEDGTGGISSVVNGYYSQEHIKFGWIVPDNVTYKAGTTKVIVFCNGKLPDGSDYLLKTKPFLYTIHDTIDVGSGIPKPDDNWFLQFEEQQEALVQQSEGYRDEAVEAASSASSSATSANDSATLAESYAVGGTDTRPNEDTDNAKYYYEQIVAYPTTGLLGRVQDLEEATKHLSNDDVYPYAPEIEIEDALGVNAKDVSVKITSQQDLHGYDKPWAGGAGKNKLPMTVAGIKAANTTGTWSGNVYTINGINITVQTDDGNNVIGISTSAGTPSSAISFDLYTSSENFLPSGTHTLTGCPSGGSDSTYKVDIVDTSLGTTYAKDTGNGSPVQSITGSHIHCRIVLYAVAQTAKTFYPMIRLATVSDATFEPYSNNCPISGFTSVDVKTEGKNLYDKDSTADGYLSDAYIFSNGSVGSSTGWTTSPYIRIKPNTSYVISGVRGNDPAYCFYDKYKNYISGTAYGGQSTVNATAPSNARYIRISAAKDVLSAIQFEEGTTATTYEPYTAHTAIVQLGNTIYGGTINVTTGVMTVTHEIVVFTGAESESWGLSSNSRRVTNASITSTVKKPINNSTVANIISSQFAATTANATFSGATAGIAIDDAGVICVNDGSGEMTVSAWKTWLSSNPLQVVYELATPITIQLIPAELELLKGYNYITANTGDISLTTISIESLAIVLDDRTANVGYGLHLTNFAPVVEFEDAFPSNAVDVITKIEPVQDLHGYDKPWVGGTGKNKLPMTVEGIKSANTSGTWSGNDYTINGVTFTIQTDTDNNVVGIKANGTASSDTEFSFTRTATVESGQKLSGCDGGSVNTYGFGIGGYGMILYNNEYTITSQTGTNKNVYIKIFSGYNAQNLMSYPMLRLSSETSATFAPYSNICPISGFTETSVVANGKNLYNKAESPLSAYLDDNGKVASNANNAVVYVPCEPNTTYTISKQTGIRFRVAYSDVVPQVDTQCEGMITNNTANNITITTGANSKYIVAWVWNASDSITKQGMLDTIQIEQGSTATAYEPYKGKTYIIDLGGTIYGGILDVTNGVLTATHEIGDMGDLTYNYNQSLGIFGTSVISNRADFDATKVQVICSVLKGLTAKDGTGMSEADDNTIAFNDGNVSKFLRIKCTAYTDGTAFKTAMTGQKIVYELATPITINLNPTQIKLLEGYNAISSSTGDVSVTRGDIEHVISKTNDWVNYLLSAIPIPPSTDGEYTLQLSIVDGVPTYSWASNS